MFQFPWNSLHNLRGTPDVQLNIFPDSIHKKGFFIFYPVAIFNCQEKLVQNKYLCGGSQNISSLLEISCALAFGKVLKILLNDNSLIFKNPYNRVIWTAIISKHSRELDQKRQQGTIICVNNFRILVRSHIQQYYLETDEKN